MARLKVNPTRMVMNELQDRLVIAKQGHRLLKEKQDSMIRQFMEVYDEATLMRKQVEDDFSHMYRHYNLASIEEDETVLMNALTKSEQIMHVSQKSQSILGTHTTAYYLDEFEKMKQEPSIFGNHYALDDIRKYHDRTAQHMVELASLEHTCSVMAEEIKQTRRRVNALEHRTIPDLEETIKYINQRIDDQMRSQQARIMKVTR